MIGGLALGARGVVRGTKDVDIVVDPAPDNLKLVAEVAVAAGGHVQKGEVLLGRSPAEDEACRWPCPGPARRRESRRGRELKRLRALDLVRETAVEMRECAHAVEAQAYDEDWHVPQLDQLVARQVESCG